MKIGFVALGKLGLPCALAVESRGYQVCGYDVNPQIQRYIDEKKIPYREEGAEELLQKTKIEVKNLFSVLTESDICFVSIQTPHDPRYEGITPLPKERVDFDYSYLIAGMKDIIQEIVHYNEYINGMILDGMSDETERKQFVVSIISTVLPGTMYREIFPLVPKELTNLHIVYNPFFIAMGTTIQDFLYPEFVLLGVDDPYAAEIVKDFYKKVLNPFPREADYFPKVFECSINTAEAIKVLYNTYITGKICFANAAMELCEKTGADVDHLIDALSLADRRIISASYMRAGMGDGGGCFPAGQLVMTYNGMKPIEEINEGDMVLSGNGEFCKVIKTYVRDYEGDMILLKTKGLPHTLMTADHPVIASTDLRTRVPDGRRNTLLKISELMSDDNEIKASDLTYDNMLYWPKINEGREPGMPPEYLELAGWYLSEGSLELNSRRGRIRFDLHAKEMMYAERIKELIERITSERFGLIPKRKNLRGLFSRVTIKIEGNSLSVRFGSKRLAELLFNDFGKGAATKYIPPQILWSKQSLLLLKGLILGDGHRNKNGISYSTISKDLAWGSFIILHRLDLCPSLRVIPPRGIHKKAYEVRVRNKYLASKLCDIIGWDKIENPVDIQNYVVTNKGTFRHIIQIHKTWFKGPVYNLWIDRHNTYVVPCGTVHNCHPRDNIALSHIAKKLNISYDWWENLMMAREKQTEWLAQLIEDEYFNNDCNLDIMILGYTFKPETNLTIGSPSLLLKELLLIDRGIDEKQIKMYDPWVDPVYMFSKSRELDPNSGQKENELYQFLGDARIFFIGTKHEVFRNCMFPAGSIVIDPFRYISDQDGVTVKRIGQAKSNS